MATGGQLKLIGIPRFETEFEVVDISDEIKEELMVINAIYGDGTWRIETTYSEHGSSKIRTRLQLPLQDNFDDAVSLSIVLPSAYPHERPEFKGVSKWNMLPQPSLNIHVLMFVAIHEVFEPGLVCMHEAMEYVAERSPLLDESGMLCAPDAIESHSITLGLTEELQWTLWDDLDVSDIAAEAVCTVCMDEDLAFRMAPLPCGCHYCMTCLNGKHSTLHSIPESWRLIN